MQKTITSICTPALGPYTQAVISGSTVYVSGQLPINPETGQMPTRTADQAQQSLNNIKELLEVAGSSIEQVLRLGFFMTNLEEIEEVNEVYELFFCERYPARTTIQVAALPKGAKIEIEAIAEL
jgi:2-iminobutanoate/2-iminopropanoate deaminase